MSCYLDLREICRFALYAGIFLITICSCSNGNSSEGRTPEKDSSAIVELPFPMVPDSIESPERRADYAIARFWEDMDFTDTALSLDTAFMEQNFANYIQLYDYATEAGRNTATERLMVCAAVSEAAYRFVADIAERYLTDPNSPMLNDEYFLPFIHSFLNGQVFSPEEKERYVYLETQILKNRPGSVGADFSFIDRAGKRRKLSDAVRDSQLTLLLFYDYECRTCAAMEHDIAEDQTLSDAMDAGSLRVVAVNVFGDDLKKWKNHAATLPEEWSVGYSPGNEVVDNEIYHIKAAPTLYLLDARGRVILKDAPLATAVAVISSISLGKENPSMR